MIILSLTVVGAFSFFTLGVDLFPKMTSRRSLSRSSTGASPRRSRPRSQSREAAINTISALTTALHLVEGVSQVFVQFLLDKDVDVAAKEIRDKINLIRGDLPETAEDPVILKLDTDAAPVLRIRSANKSLREVTDIADKEIRAHRVHHGVGQVQIIGGATREIQIRLDPTRCALSTSPSPKSSERCARRTWRCGARGQGARELTVRTMGASRTQPTSTTSLWPRAALMPSR